MIDHRGLTTEPQSHRVWSSKGLFNAEGAEFAEHAIWTLSDSTGRPA